MIGTRVERESNGSQRTGWCLTSRSEIGAIGYHPCLMSQHLERAKQRQNSHVMDMGDTVDMSLVVLWGQAWSLGVFEINFIAKYLTDFRHVRV